MTRFADRPAAAWVLGSLALAFAAVGAKPYAGSWNDGSRLAAVESLLDRGTLAIDDSIFCRVPTRYVEAGTLPYPAERADLLTHGTLDKLWIDGHFYSDKPLFASILMAGVYRPLEWLGAPSPAERPDVFVRTLTILTSGLSFAVAVGCLWAVGRRVGLDPRWRSIWLAAFSFGTYALTYTQSVNSGAMQLGILAAICWLLVRENRWNYGATFALGTLAGLGFILDFGSGPPLVACLFALMCWQTRSVRSVLAFAIGVSPWVAAAVGTNYAVAGLWKPLNMYPDHFRFPGSPFTEQSLTGFLHHSPFDQVLYAAAMMIGKQGFLNHNLPLLLAAGAVVAVFRRCEYRAELGSLLTWCGLSWLMYAVLSNNMGGACCSIRWFVPFLAPGFWLLAVVLRDRPELRPRYVALVSGGFVLGCLMWWKGPWTMRMIPQMWPIFATTLVACGVVARYVRSVKAEEAMPVNERLAA